MVTSLDLTCPPANGAGVSDIAVPGVGQKMDSTGLQLNIAIIDANPLLADGIAALLAQDGGIAARTAFLGPLPAAAAGEEFDLILIDPSQVDTPPKTLIQDLGAGGRPVVGYAGTGSVSLARACIAAGFRGILPKTVSFETLKIALATAAQGGIFIDAAFAAAIAPTPGAEDPPTLPPQDACLSERELFVLKSVAHGKSMKEIGKELDLSSKTIETYKARGSSKLNLSGRRQIVEFAIAQGWVEGARLTAG